MTKPYVRLDKDNAAVLLVDHQTGLLSLVRDIDPDKFKNNVLALADIASYFKLPTILTTSFENGPNGPLVPELKSQFPQAPYIARPGNINAWDNEDFVKAVKATGKKQLIIAGVVTEVCVAFPALSAIAEGAFVTAWSSAVPQECNLLLGQQMTVVPEYQKAVYLLPKNSVFSWEQDSQVFTLSDNQLNALTVDILGSTPEQYIVASDQDLSQLQVLSQSVAAVKGIMLGLGGE